MAGGEPQDNGTRSFAHRLGAIGKGDPWAELFAMATEEAGGTYRGMVPFWVYDPEGGCRIERHVPAIPLSRDILRYEDLRRSLAVHRMVFGQPRQEDLLAYLVERIGEERLEGLRGLLQVDLAPRG